MDWLRHVPRPGPFFALLPAWSTSLSSTSKGRQLSRQPSKDGLPPPSPDPFGPAAGQPDRSGHASKELFHAAAAAERAAAQARTLFAGTRHRPRFTAHPTEIACGIRCGTNNAGSPPDPEALKQDSPPSSMYKRNLRLQLEEENSLWWRTEMNSTSSSLGADEGGINRPALTSSKCSRCHAPLLRLRIHQRLSRQLSGWNHRRECPSCTFGSWVARNRDGTRSVTPDITWRNRLLSTSF